MKARVRVSAGPYTRRPLAVRAGADASAQISFRPADMIREDNRRRK